MEEGGYVCDLGWLSAHTSGLWFNLVANNSTIQYLAEFEFDKLSYCRCFGSSITADSC